MDDMGEVNLVQNIKKQHRKDYFWNTIGVFAQNATSPILLMVVTRFNGITQSGVFSFAFAVSLMLWSFGMWGGRTYQVSDTQSEFEHRSYIVVRIILAIGMILIAAIFSWVNHFNMYETGVMIALVLFKAAESLSDVFYGVLQVNDKLYVSGYSLAIKASIGVISFIFIDFITRDVVWSILSVLIVNVVVFCFYDFIKVNSIEQIRFPRNRLRKYGNEAIQIMKRCASIFSIFFLAMFSLNIPRYFIDLYSKRDIGYFGIIALPITLIILLMSFILQPNILTLSKLYRNKDYIKFKQILRKILLASFIIGVVILAVTIGYGAELLHLVFDVNFTSYKLPLIIIVIGGILSALIAVYLNVFVIIRKTLYPFFILLITNILLSLISFFVVRQGGLSAGVWAFAVTNLVQMVILHSYYNTVIKRDTNEK